MHHINFMPFVTKHVHFVSEGFLAEKRLFVMLVPISFFTTHFLVPFNFLMFVFLCQDWVHFWPLNYWLYGHISHLSSCPKLFCLRRCKTDDLWNNHLCRKDTFCLLFYILVDIVSLNLQQKAACICVYNFALCTVLLSHIRTLLFSSIAIHA